MLLIELAFPAGRYHATPWGRHVNEGVCEWPPSPYRILRALYDVWKRKRSHWPEARVATILQALAAEPPVFCLPRASQSHTKSYLSQNERDPLAKAQIYDAFVALAPRASVWMGWPETDLSLDVSADLDELLSALNYLGRSESWVSARVVEGVRDVEWNCHSSSRTDVVNREVELVPVAVPIAPSEYVPPKVKNGSKARTVLSWMEALATGTDTIREEKWSHAPAMRFEDYLRPADCLSESPVPQRVQPETNVDAVLYAFDSKVLPQVIETVQIAERTRVLLMGIHKKIVGNPDRISPRFSGKSADGRPQKGDSYTPSSGLRTGMATAGLIICS